MSSASKRRDTDVMKLMMSKYKVTLADGGTNPHDFFVKFHGPKESAYQGGIWKIHVILPQEYPYKSPSIGFCNKIFHPNSMHTCTSITRATTDRSRVHLLWAAVVCLLLVDEPSGSVCLDVINQTWSPMYDLVNVFSVFLPQLLLYPNPTDPLNPHAAMVMLKDKEQYDKTIKEYVKKFASVDFAMDDDEDDDEEEELTMMNSPSLCSQTHSHSSSQSSSSVTASPGSTCLSLSSDSDLESRDSKEDSSDEMEVIEELDLDFGGGVVEDDGQMSDADEMPEDEHNNHHHQGIAL